MLMVSNTMIVYNAIQILEKREYFMIVTQNDCAFQVGSYTLLLTSQSQSTDSTVEDMNHRVNTTIDCKSYSCLIVVLYE